MDKRWKYWGRKGEWKEMETIANIAEHLFCAKLCPNLYRQKLI